MEYCDCVVCVFLLASCEIVVCLFRLSFTNFCERKFQIVARMTEGSLPRAFRDICQQTTLAASGKSILTSFLRDIYVPADVRNMAIAIKESQAVFVAGSLQEITCNLSTCGKCLEFWFFGTAESFGHVQKHLKRYCHRRTIDIVPIRGASGDLPVGPQQSEITIVSSVVLCGSWV